MKIVCGIKLKEFKFLNEEKGEFLESVSENREEKTTKLYVSVLSNMVEKAERLNDRCWADFSETMVDLAFMSIKAKSEMTLLAYLTIVKDYLAATTKEEDTMRMGHGYTMRLTREDMKRYLNKSCEKYRYLSPEEFDDVLKCKAIDSEAKAIAILLYNGIKGESFSDITNIKLEDIDLEDGKIYKNGKVLIELSEDYIKYFKETIEKDEYNVYDEDGNIDMVRKMRPYDHYRELTTGVPFIRRFEHKAWDWAKPCDGKFLARIIKDICKGIGNEHLDAQSIYNSGEAYRLLQFCDMELPSSKQWMEFKKLTGSKISKLTAESACGVILDKINK